MSIGSGDALLVIDVMNRLDFEGAEALIPWVQRMTPLLKRAVSAARGKVPVVFANDFLGDFRNDFSAVVAQCIRRGGASAALCRALKPARGDYCFLKPRHSAFFGTPLHVVLQSLKVRRIIMAGIATNLCVLFSAHDAHMLGYKVAVLSDCCAAESDEDHDVSLDQLKRFCRARIMRSDEVGFDS